MKLVELTVLAIGPFAAKMSIDFERLGSAGLFLLEGPTGSGKSTVIDAITFALYGTTAGNSSQERLHSRAAPTGTIPVVELVFEVPDGRFRVSRSPAHERPKLRGSGTTAVPTSAKLWDETSLKPELITARAKEVDAEIRRMIGLTKDQFVQTVVLPQGEFSRFLCAKPNDRAEVLKRLFATETYDAITGELQRRKHSAMRQRDDAARNVTTCTAVFAAASRLKAVDVTSTVDTDAGRLLGLATEAISEMSDHVQASERGLAAVAQVKGDRERELEAAQRIDRARRRYTEAAEALRQLEANRDEYDGWVRRARLLGAVAEVIPLHRRLVALRTESAARREAWQRAAESANLSPDTSGGDLADLLSARLSLHATLAQHAKVESELTQAAEELETDRLLAAELERRVAEHRSTLESTRRELSALAERRHSLEIRASDLNRLRIESDRLREHCDAAVELERLRKERDERRTELAKAHRASRDADDRAAELRSAYLDGIAGQLANELVEGESCPVCGAEEHPRPAPAPRTLVTRTELDAAETAWSLAAIALERADGQVRQVEERVAAAAVACGDATVEAARAKLFAALEALERATREAGELERVREQWHELTTSVGEKERVLSIEESELVATRERIRVGDERLTRARANLDPYRGSAATVGEHLADVDRLCRALEAAQKLHSAFEHSEVSLARTEVDFNAALDRADLESETIVTDLVDQLDELPGLRTRISSQDRQVASVHAILTDPEVSRVADVDPPDIVEIESRASLARDLHIRALGLNQRWRDRLATARSAATDLRDAVATLDQVERQTADVIFLAEVLSGSSTANVLDMPLVTYVLVDRFRAVVAAANDRLQVMSDGRYLLEHHGEREDRGRLAGLGLRVRDLETDSIRDPRTLSGGETFYASLSLALGLADVVTAEAGGRSLGTLFIDEGFGGLDPETLDQVMEEIDKLRTSDRVVGVVSHVRDLKDRIPNRMEIRRLGGGRSAVQIQTPD